MGAFGTKAQIMTAQSVAGTELFATARTLDPGGSDHVQVVADSGGTTDSLVISVYTTLDDSSEDWDTVPAFQFVLDTTSGDEEIVSFIVSGFYRYRIGCVRDGSTDTIVTDIYVRDDGINVD